MKLPEGALFIVVTGVGTEQEHVFAVFADGHIEGFEQPAMIVNRYPTLLAMEVLKGIRAVNGEAA